MCQRLFNWLITITCILSFAHVSAMASDSSPNPPSGLLVTGETSTQINVSWTNPGGATAIEVQYDTSSGYSNPLQLTLDAGADYAQISQLSPETPYSVRVRCKNGSAVSAWISGQATTKTLNDLILVGDSITYSFPYPRNGLTATRAIPGDVSTRAKDRFFSDVIIARPRLVTILIGTNDIANDVPLSTIESNIATMVQEAKSHGIGVILGTVLPAGNTSIRPDAVIQTLNSWIVTYAKNEGLRVADYFTAFWPYNSSNYADGLHPNTQGYGIMASVLDAVVPSALAAQGARFGSAPPDLGRYTSGGNILRGVVYGDGSPSPESAWDDNSATMFESGMANGSNGYTGIDLQGSYQLTGFRIRARQDFLYSRSFGGRLQGSNTSATSGFTDIATISLMPFPNRMVGYAITGTSTYRWVRYFSPTGGLCDVADISLYGNGSDVAVVATPVFTPAPGTYSSTQSVTLASTTSGATIRYTTDGSTPNSSSADYTGAISVSSTTTIRAIATASGMSDSQVTGGIYTISIVAPPEIVATPSFMPTPGTYSSAQSVTIACSTSGATIRYTTDGSTPNGASAVYTGAISVSSTTTIRAIATASGMSDSQVASGTYTIAAAPGGTGSGLTGTYFPSSNFTGTSVTRVDGTVDFDWGQGSPSTGIPVDYFCVRWTGQVQAQFSETYTFTTLCDDGVRLWVNGQLLVDDWTDHPPTENSGTITLLAGQKYDVKMEYFENGGGAVAKLSWASPSTAKQIIPMSQLFPSEVTTTGDLPAGWTAQDVGGVAVGGATTQSNGTWTVSGSGSDIWDNADGCRFVSQRLTGDVQVTAQVNGLTNTDIWAKAGVMIRESMATGSRHASTFATASNGLAYQRRLNTDGASSHTAGPGIPAPYWVRIERVGNVVISSASPNGSTWTEIRRETITMNAAIYVGLAVTSHNNSALCTATFTNVQVVGVAAASN